MNKSQVKKLVKEIISVVEGPESLTKAKDLKPGDRFVMGAGVDIHEQEVVTIERLGGDKVRIQSKVTYSPKGPNVGTIYNRIYNATANLRKSTLNEEHGDVHYWGAQPKDSQHKISTGYKGTVSLKENMTERQKSLRKLIIESAKEVINEYQHEQQHEQQEVSQFTAIKKLAEQLIVMHSPRAAYDEAKELEMVKQIKKIAMEVEAKHTGTKITTNEKANR